MEQTNVYASQVYSKNNPPKTPWRAVSKEEMLAFLGLNIAMGVVNLPEVNMYWPVNPLLDHPWFCSILPRNRFKQIVRFFHVVDNTTRSEHPDDKLFKVRPLVDSLLDKCKKHFHPSRNLSIDESIIGTKSRISFRQYIKNKPTKWGVKMFVLADSKTGFIVNFEIYTGKRDVPDDKGATYHTCMRLLENHLGQGYCVCSDSL